MKILSVIYEKIGTLICGFYFLGMLAAPFFSIMYCYDNFDGFFLVTITSLGTMVLTGLAIRYIGVFAVLLFAFLCKE